MQPRPNPPQRFIVAHLEYTASRLDLGADAPPRDEGAREGSIGEVERRCVVREPAHPRRLSPSYWTRRSIIANTVGKHGLSRYAAGRAVNASACSPLSPTR
jgi:hypothetical protein